MFRSEDKSDKSTCKSAKSNQLQLESPWLTQKIRPPKKKNSMLFPHPSTKNVRSLLMCSQRGKAIGHISHSGIQRRPRHAIQAFGLPGRAWRKWQMWSQQNVGISVGIYIYVYIGIYNVYIIWDIYIIYIYICQSICIYIYMSINIYIYKSLYIYMWKSPYIWLVPKWGLGGITPKSCKFE